ncbi:MAG: MoaD/ThiS family protein [Candidatus Aenigmatarchaeota archaeon]
MSETAEEVSVKVKLIGNLRKYGDHVNEMEVERGTRVREIVEDFDIPKDENIMVMVNEEPKYMKYEVEEGDVIDVLRPVSGE